MIQEGVQGRTHRNDEVWGHRSRLWSVRALFQSTPAGPALWYSGLGEAGLWGAARRIFFTIGPWHMQRS